MIKQRTMVHIALNAKGECVSHLICAAGKFIPFSATTTFKKDRNRPLSFWSECYYTMPSVSHWKGYCKRVERAVRFQRAMLIGGAA